MQTSDQYTAHGETKLEPHVSSWAKAFIMLSAALLWNAILSRFLWKFLENFRNDGLDWLLLMFFVPLIVIGIILVILFIAAFLEVSNPKFHLVLNSSNLKLGDTVGLRWESSGSLRRLRSLQFTLEGKEVATRSSGQKSMTVESVFYRKQLFTTRLPTGHSIDKIKFTIPSESMHSFEAKHNQFEWHLHVHGEIDRWPDARNKYKLNVRPKEAP